MVSSAAKGSSKTIHNLYYHSNVRSKVIREEVEIAKEGAFRDNIVALIVTQITTEGKVNMSRKKRTIHLVERWLD